MNTETKIFIVLVIVFLIGFSVIVGLSTNAEKERLEAKYQEASSKIEEEKVEITAVLNIQDEQILSDSEHISENDDEVVIFANEGGILTAANLTITKNGNALNLEKSQKYGLNSAILAGKDSQITISASNVATAGEGANAIFCTEENSIIYVSGTEIATSQKDSSALVANNSGKINADDVKVTTSAENSYGIFASSKDVTISAINSTLETKGHYSPLMYVKGDVSVKNIEGTADVSGAAVVEGDGILNIEASEIITSGEGISEDGFDNAGISIINKDANEGNSTLTLSETTLEINDDSNVYETAPMFFVTNASADINITDSELNFGSNILLKILGNNGLWGKKGSNGGDVIFTATEQSLEGNMQVDDISILSFNLIDSEYEGAINPENEAKEINVNIDATSNVTLTGDWYITTLNVEDETLKNIDSNGYTIYYDSTNSANEWIGDGITILDGGKIEPME